MCCLYPTNEKDKDILTYGNHIINFAYHNDALYGVDLTNHCTFFPISKDTLQGIGDDITLKYIPGGDIVFKLTTSLQAPTNLFSEIDETREMLKKACHQKTITIDEYRQLVRKANEFIIARKKNTSKFYCR